MTALAWERGALAKPAKADWRHGLRRLAVASALLASAVAAAWYGDRWWTTGRFVESTDDAYVGGDVTPLAPHIDAFIGQVLVTDNQRVHAGELLIKLDDRDYRLALGEAQAQVANAEAGIETIDAQLGAQQAQIGANQAQADQAQAALVFAQQQAERYQELAQKAGGSVQSAQQYASQLRQQEAALASARASLQLAQRQVDTLKAQRTSAVAGLARAKAQRDQAQLNLEYCEIRSPIDGYVGNRAARAGAYATRGTYLLSVSPVQGLWVDANFKEDQLTRMLPGQIATVTADALPGHVFRGQVASLAPGTGAVFSVIPAENATGNFTKIVQRVPVRVVLDRADPDLARLRPGLSTVVRVDTREGGRS